MRMHIGERVIEGKIKEKVAASIVMIPPETEEKVKKGDLCSVCGNDAKEIVYYAKKY